MSEENKTQLHYDSEPDFEYRPPFIPWDTTPLPLQTMVYPSCQLKAFLNKVTKPAAFEAAGPYSMHSILYIYNTYLDKLKKQTGQNGTVCRIKSPNLQLICNGEKEVPWTQFHHHLQRHILIAERASKQQP